MVLFTTITRIIMQSVLSTWKEGICRVHEMPNRAFCGSFQTFVSKYFGNLGIGVGDGKSRVLVLRFCLHISCCKNTPLKA